MARSIDEVYYRVKSCENLLQDVMEFLRENMTMPANDVMISLPMKEEVSTPPPVIEVVESSVESIEESKPLFTQQDLPIPSGSAIYIDLTKAKSEPEELFFGAKSKVYKPTVGAKKDIVDNLELLNINNDRIDPRDEQEQEYIDKFAGVTEDMREVFDRQSRRKFSDSKQNLGIGKIAKAVIGSPAGIHHKLPKTTTSIFSEILNGNAYRKQSSKSKGLTHSLKIHPSLTQYGNAIKEYLKDLGD
jgi:hypothetical protein